MNCGGGASQHDEMKRLDRFILKAFIGPFVAILLVVIFILMMQFLWVYIDELVGKGLEIIVILEFLLWGGLTILPLALPLATLLSSMMTMGQMSENNELIAIKSAGISLSRVMMPLFIASILISIGAFYASDRVVPIAYDKIYTLRDDISKTKNEIKIPSGIFYDGIDGYILRVNERNDETGMMYGVMVYDHTGRKGNTSVTLADSALIKMSKGRDYLTFTLFNGTNYQEDNLKRYRDTTLQVQKVNFSKQELIIALKNYAFEKSDSTRFSDQVKSMSLVQLQDYQDTLQVAFGTQHEQHIIYFLKGGSFAKRSQLDTSMLNKGVSIFENENFLDFETPERQIIAYHQIGEKADEIISQLEGFDRESYEHQFFLRRTNLEIVKKFAGSLACLLLFFIGAPLGSLVKRGKLGAAAIASVLFFVLYWVLDLVGSKLAKDGAVDAFTGAFIWVYLLVPVGAYFCWKAAHDSDFFNTEKITSAVRKLRSMLLGMVKKTRIVYMGTPDFAVAPLEALISKGYDVAGVVTVADKPSGRGLKMNESAVKKYAVEHNIPVLQPVKLKDPEFLEALKAWNADLFVVVAFRMLPEEVWSMPKLGTFNLHAALLPQYRGAAPINWAVINGEKMTGVTTFMIDKDIDTGSIMLRESCRISDTDTAGDVHDRLMAMGATLVVETVDGLIQGTVEQRVQRSFIQGSEQLKPAPKLTKELCRIHWNDSTAHIYNLIRGLSPYPTAFTELLPLGNTDGGPASGTAGDGALSAADSAAAAAPLQLKVFSAEKMSFAEAGASAQPAPGTVLSDGKSYLAIATADGAISIKELQLSGKKRMDVKSFLLGFRDPESYRAEA